MRFFRLPFALVAGLGLASGCDAPHSAEKSPAAQPAAEHRAQPEAGPGMVAVSPEREAAAPDSDALDRSYEAALDQLDRAYDPLSGRWGQAPMGAVAAPIVHSLMRAQWHGDTARLEQVRESLGHYGRLIDPVVGGVRHDPTSTPEVGTDAVAQAEALAAFGVAYRVTGDPAYLENALAVGRYVRDTLAHPEGGFHASVGPDLADPAQGPDRGIHTDENGMLIAGMAELYRATGDTQWRTLAEQALHRLRLDHVRGDRIYHDDAHDGPVLHLADHVRLAAAMNALAEATMDVALWNEADALIDTTVERFQDRARGGFFDRSGTAFGALLDRSKPYGDNALLARLLVTRGHRKHSDDDLETAERALRSLGVPGALRAEREGVAAYLVALEVLRGPLAVVRVVGPAGDARTRALYERALSLSELGAVPLQEEPTASEYPYDGTPTIYLCAATACSAPITEPERLDPLFQAFAPSAG